MLALFFLLLVCFSSSFSSPATSRNVKLPDDRIVGGIDATALEFPFLVSIQSAFKTGRDSHFCGGTLVNETWVLTAAHCAKGHAASDIRIVAGELDFDVESGLEQVRIGKRTVINFDYELNQFMYDIAMIEVTEPFVFNEQVSGVALPLQDQETIAGEKMTVAGWGALEEGGALSSKLKKVVIPAWDDQDCIDAYYAIFFDVDPSMICAGLEEGRKDACQGDSGGPLMNENGEIIGIVSWGYGCARQGAPGVYTEVSHYRDWIKGVLDTGYGLFK